MATEKRRLGRPPKIAPAGTRASLGLKVTAAVKQRIDAAAHESGRTQSQEAERLIELALQWEQQMAAVRKVAHGSTHAALRRLGWMPVTTTKGRVWLEPDVPASAATEVVGAENLPADLGDIISEAVTGALTKAGIGRSNR